MQLNQLRQFQVGEETLPKDIQLSLDNSALIFTAFNYHRHDT